ncbi:hypothetical protein ACFSHR_00845 [Azotobacter chroococcum]
MSQTSTHHPAKPVLFVLTSHGTKGSTGQPTGYYLGEVTHPWLYCKPPASRSSSPRSRAANRRSTA